MQKCISYILDDYCSVKSEESQKKHFFAKKCKLRKKLLPLMVNTTVVLTPWNYFFRRPPNR